MSLDDAIALLCRVHLRDIESEWYVMIGATPWPQWESDQYAEAWAALREHLLRTRSGFCPEENRPGN